MSVTAVIRELVAAGLTLEQAVMAAEKFEAHVEAERVATMPKRSAGAERQARYRARLRGKVTESDATSDRNSDATCVTPPPLRDKSTPPTPSLRSDSQHPRGERFLEFWRAYPRRVGANPKQPAEEKFCRLLKASAEPMRLADEIIAGAQRYAASVSEADPRFTAQAITWLNQGRWKDDDSRPERPPPPRGRPSTGRHNGFSFAEMASVDSVQDLVREQPDGSRDHNRQSEAGARAADPRVRGYAGAVQQRDREESFGTVVDLQRVGAAWR